MKCIQMNFLELISSRRSVSKFTNKPVSEDILHKIMEAGSWAPNHKRTEPWRFVVFNGEGRHTLQQAILEGTANAHAHLPEDEKKLKLSKMENKAFRAPCVIGVWCAVGRGKINPPVWEDYAAVSACLQNMSLATHALGLGSIWRSGSLCDYPEITALCKTETDSLNADKGDKLMGFLYLGYPDENVAIPKRDRPELEGKIAFFS